MKSDQVSNRSVRRNDCKNQEPRGREQIDNNLEIIKVLIPLFNGRTDLEAYLEWEKKLELVFECHDYSELVKVEITTIEFLDYAIIWWDQLTMNRRRIGERPFET